MEEHGHQQNIGYSNNVSDDASGGGVNAYDGVQQQNSAVNAHENSQQQSAWHDALPEDIREHFTRFKTEEELAKSYLNLRSSFSKKVSDFGIEDFDQYQAYKTEHLAIPNSPEGYYFNKDYLKSFDMIYPDLMSDEDESFLKKFFHSSGLDQHAAMTAYTGINYLVSQGLNLQSQTEKAMEENAYNVLQADWGSAYDHKMAGLEKMLDEVAPRVAGCDADTFLKEVQDAKLYLYPNIVKVLSNIGATTVEPASVATRTMSKTDYSHALQDFLSDKDTVNALLDPTHKNHRQANERHRELIIKSK